MFAQDDISIQKIPITKNENKWVALVKLNMAQDGYIQHLRKCINLPNLPHNEVSVRVKMDDTYVTDHHNGERIEYRVEMIGSSYTLHYGHRGHTSRRKLLGYRQGGS